MDCLSKPELREAALGRSRWFQGRPAALRDWISSHARPRVLRAGERLYLRGEPTTGMYLVVDGTIRVSNATAEGRERLLAIVAAPMWIGEAGLFDGAPHEHDAWAASDACLLHLGQQTLLDFLADHPVHWRSFGILMAHRLRLALHGVTDGALSPASTRLARRLLAMAGGYGDTPVENHLRIQVQQDQLAAMLSISRQTVNKLLREFESSGWLHLGRGAIDILAVDGLRSLASLDDTSA